MKPRNDIQEMRRQNQKLILDMIYKNGVVSRAEMSKALGLSKPTVNEHVDLLLKTGIIQEVGEGISNAKGGRKPILIAPNETYKYIIAIDLSLTQPLAALGNMLVPAIEKVLIESREKAGDLNQSIKRAIDWLMQTCGITNDQIGVIVVSTPGIVNDQNQIILRNKQHELTYNTDLFAFLSEEYNKVVLIKNDVNMSVLAEKEIQERKDKRNFVLLACGNGFGAGIILNGILIEGHNKAAGEVGFMLEEGVPLEDTITIQPFIEKVKQESEHYPNSKLKDIDKMSFAHVLKAYQEDDPAVISVLKDIGYKLGVCANNIAALLDLELILLGGDYLEFEDVLIPEIRKVVDRTGHLTKPQIEPSSLGHNSGVIGCMNVAREYLVKTVENENGGI